MVVQIYKKRRKCALWNLKIRAPLPPTAEKTHGHGRDEKKNETREKKRGRNRRNKGVFVDFFPVFRFFFPSFSPLVGTDAMSMGKNEHFFSLILNLLRRKTNNLWGGCEKDRATFFGSSKHCLYIRAVDVPSPRRFHKPLGGDDERPAPRLLLTRQIDVRTPTGRPQDPMGWLELRPFF